MLYQPYYEPPCYTLAELRAQSDLMRDLEWRFMLAQRDLNAMQRANAAQQAARVLPSEPTGDYSLEGLTVRYNWFHAADIPVLCNQIATLKKSAQAEVVQLALYPEVV